MEAGRPRLWLADVGPASQPDWAAAHARWLSASEHTRWQRFVRPLRRAQFLAGHVLLRHLMGAWAAADAASVAIESRADGSAVIALPTGFRCSLAHSNRWVAALVDREPHGVGVDIEWMRPDRAIEAIVEAGCGRRATSREHAYRLWALHEAQLKARAAAGSWVATLPGHALAVCARGVPDATLFDLESARLDGALLLDWDPAALLGNNTPDGQ
jgi:4'-phosphopantetheinyl transferase